MRAWAIKFKSGYLGWDSDYGVLTAARLFPSKKGAEFELESNEQIVEVEIKEVENE